MMRAGGWALAVVVLVVAAAGVELQEGEVSMLEDTAPATKGKGGTRGMRAGTKKQLKAKAQDQKLKGKLKPKTEQTRLDNKAAVNAASVSPLVPAWADGSKEYKPTQVYNPRKKAAKKKKWKKPGMNSMFIPPKHSKAEDPNTYPYGARKIAFMERQMKQGVKRASRNYHKRMKHQKLDKATTKEDEFKYTSWLKRWNDMHDAGQLAIAKARRWGVKHVREVEYKLYSKQKQAKAQKLHKKYVAYVKASEVRRKKTRAILLAHQKRMDKLRLKQLQKKQREKEAKKEKRKTAFEKAARRRESIFKGCKAGMSVAECQKYMAANAAKMAKRDHKKELNAEIAHKRMIKIAYNMHGKRRPMKIVVVKPKQALKKTHPFSLDVKRSRQPKAPKSKYVLKLKPVGL